MFGIIVIFTCVFSAANAKIIVHYNETIIAKPLIDLWPYEILQANYLYEFQTLRATTNSIKEKLDVTNKNLENAVANIKVALNDIKSQMNRKIATKTISSCSEVKLPVNGEDSAVFYLKLPNSRQPVFPVLCMKGPYGGDPWTIIQRRRDGSIDFYRDWDSYANGFGSLYNEFWLGLEKIHQLTTSKNHELWIKFDDFDGGSHYARYQSFVIDNEQSKYKLSKIGQYFGDTPDSFSPHVNEKFTTKDNNNDRSDGNCAVDWTGAWWYGKCFQSNLNGKYLREFNRTDGRGYPERGIIWREFSVSHSMKYVHMAIRPTK